MSKLASTTRVTSQYNRQSLHEILSLIDAQVNGLSEGRVTNTYNAATAVPTTGSYQIGDFVRNSSPSELGAGGSKYVLFGWVCSDDDPLTFLQCRFLTGN